MEGWGRDCDPRKEGAQEGRNKSQGRRDAKEAEDGEKLRGGNPEEIAVRHPEWSETLLGVSAQLQSELRRSANLLVMKCNQVFFNQIKIKFHMAGQCLKLEGC